MKNTLRMPPRFTQEQVKLALDLIGAHRDTTRYVFSV